MLITASKRFQCPDCQTNCVIDRVVKAMDGHIYLMGRCVECQDNLRVDIAKVMTDFFKTVEVMH